VTVQRGARQVGPTGPQGQTAHRCYRDTAHRDDGPTDQKGTTGDTGLQVKMRARHSRPYGSHRPTAKRLPSQVHGSYWATDHRAKGVNGNVGATGPTGALVRRVRQSYWGRRERKGNRFSRANRPNRSDRRKRGHGDMGSTVLLVHPALPARRYNRQYRCYGSRVMGNTGARV
jgi:hypothetical protein